MNEEKNTMNAMNEQEGTKAVFELEDPHGGGKWTGDQEAIAELKRHLEKGPVEELCKTAREREPDPESIKARFNAGRISHRAAIKELARTFPSIAHLQMFADASPFDGEIMDGFRARVLCHGGKCAFQFIAAVWNPDAKRKCGKFDTMEAMAVWDGQHRAAFVAWASDPWWP